MPYLVDNGNGGGKIFDIQNLYLGKNASGMMLPRFKL